MKVLSNNIAVLDQDTHISAWVELAGRVDHDQNMLPLLRRYIRRDDTVLDAGAFIGDHTVFYARLAGKVLAFEPNPEAYRCLRHNTMQFANVECYNIALSDYIKPYRVVEQPNKGASFVVGDSDSRLNTTTIDELELARCDFIKIDTEGTEYDVLKGAMRTMKRCRPVILVEVNAGTLARMKVRPEDVLAILEGFRYDVRNVYREQPMDGPQFDALAVPEEKISIFAKT